MSEFRIRRALPFLAAAALAPLAQALCPTVGHLKQFPLAYFLRTDVLNLMGIFRVGGIGRLSGNMI